jgi:hypothetical protein
VAADQEIDAYGGRAFLAGFGHEDHIAIQLDVLALQQEHDHEARGHDLLVVHRAPGIDETVLADRAKGVHRPLGTLRDDHVGMSEDGDGPGGAVALDARDQVGAGGIERQQLHRNAFALQHVREIFGGFGFVARRIGGVDAEKGGEVAEGFGV